MNFLRYLDIYKSEIIFKIHGQKGFATELGEIYSLLTFILFISSLIFFGTDFFCRYNPNVFFETFLPELREKIVINNSNFNFAWRIEDGQGKFFDFNKILYPRIKYSFYEKDQIANEIICKNEYFQIKKCKEVNINQVYMKNLNLNEWFCLDFSEFEVLLGGDDRIKGFIGFINLEILFCPNNDFSDKNCINLKTLKEKVEINQMLYISMVYPEIFISNTELNEPIKLNVKNYYNTINLNSIQKDKLYIQKHIYNDDQGLIFSNIKQTKIISGTNFQNNFHFITDKEILISKSSILYSFNIYFNEKRKIYFRKFMKIQELAALIGGIMKIIYFFFDFLNIYPNNFFKTRTLINEFFYLKKENEKNNYILYKYMVPISRCTFRKENQEVILIKNNNKNFNIKNEKNKKYKEINVNKNRNIGKNLNLNIMNNSFDNINNNKKIFINPNSSLIELKSNLQDKIENLIFEKNDQTNKSMNNLDANLIIRESGKIKKLRNESIKSREEANSNYINLVNYSESQNKIKNKVEEIKKSLKINDNIQNFYSNLRNKNLAIQDVELNSKFINDSELKKNEKSFFNQKNITENNFNEKCSTLIEREKFNFGFFNFFLRFCYKRFPKKVK